MRLEDKTVIIKRLTTDNIDKVSTVEVAVHEELAEDIMRLQGTYDLTLQRAYNNIDDPQLILDVRAKLEGIPE